MSLCSLSGFGEIPCNPQKGHRLTHESLDTIEVEVKKNYELRAGSFICKRHYDSLVANVRHQAKRKRKRDQEEAKKRYKAEKRKAEKAEKAKSSKVVSPFFVSL